MSTKGVEPGILRNNRRNRLISLMYEFIQEPTDPNSMLSRSKFGNEDLRQRITFYLMNMSVYNLIPRKELHFR